MVKSRVSPRRFGVPLLAVLVAVVALAYIIVRSHAAVVVGDLNNDGTVNIFDLSILLSDWGTTSAVADLNSDGTVNIFDLSILLSNWGQTATPPPSSSPSPTPTPSASNCPPGQAQANDGTCITLPAGTTKLAFDDEFSANSPDTTLWDVLNVHGDRSNNEPECYLPSQVSESGGFLTELLENRAVTCPIDSSNGGTGTLSSNYPSGAIQMKSFNFAYGTLQARIKFAGTGPGPWPALWMLGHDCQTPNYLVSTCDWPNSGSEENDIAEYFDQTAINNEIWNSGATHQCEYNITTAATQYHIYGLNWSPGKLVYTLDGATTCTLTANVNSDNMFLIINTAIGGSGGGTITNSDLPQTTSVDYVRVFQ